MSGDAALCRAVFPGGTAPAERNAGRPPPGAVLFESVHGRVARGKRHHSSAVGSRRDRPDLCILRLRAGKLSAPQPGAGGGRAEPQRLSTGRLPHRRLCFHRKGLSSGTGDPPLPRGAAGQLSAARNGAARRTDGAPGHPCVVLQGQRRHRGLSFGLRCHRRCHGSHAEKGGAGAAQRCEPPGQLRNGKSDQDGGCGCQADRRH